MPWHLKPAAVTARSLRLNVQVRFFERVKLERQISKLERQPASTDMAELAARAARLAQLRDDLQVGPSASGTDKLSEICFVHTSRER